MSQILARMRNDLACCFRQLVATDIVFKAIAFVLLTPLLGLLLRVILATSGNTLLADQDILYFLLGPAGWICALLIGGIWLAIVALEQSALLAVIAANRQNRSLSTSQAIYFAAYNALPVMKVTVRMVAYTLLMIAPFLVAIGLIYTLLLGEHDINFYLQERPPEFLLAAVLAFISGVALIGVLLWKFSGWFFALPAILFEQITTWDTLEASKDRARGGTGIITSAIVLWFLASTIISTIASGTVVLFGRMVTPLAEKNLPFLLLVIGLLVLLWFALGLIVNLISSILFATMLNATYEQMGGEPRLDKVIDDADAKSGARFKLTARRVAALCVSAAILAAVIGAVLVRTIRIEHEVTVIAHRGASAEAPENTLASIKLAIEQGADWVEIDVQETADGEVAVFHDSDFMKLAGNPLKIWEATAADLEAIDIGSSYSSEYQSERTPRLEEVLELCKGKVQVLIELKYYGHDVQLEQCVLDLVKKHEMESQVMYMSLKLPAIEKLKSIEPEAKVGILLSVSAGDRNKFPADLWAINARFAARRTVKQAHKNDRLVFVWTVNDALTMSRLIGRGVDGLITDDPVLARSVINQLNQLSPAERLLLEFADLFGLKNEVLNQ